MYKCEINADNSRKLCLGSTGCLFRERFRNHVASFKNEPENETNREGDNDTKGDRTKINIRNKKRNKTALGDWVRELHKNKKEFELQWSIVDKGRKYKPGKSKRCNLCLLEAYDIVNSKEEILNKKAGCYTVISSSE